MEAKVGDSMVFRKVGKCPLNHVASVSVRIQIIQHYENYVFITILVQHVSAALCGINQVVLQAHEKEFCSLRKGLPLTNSEYSILVTWLLFRMVE